MIERQLFEWWQKQVSDFSLKNYWSTLYDNTVWFYIQAIYEWRLKQYLAAKSIENIPTINNPSHWTCENVRASYKNNITSASNCHSSHTRRRIISVRRMRAVRMYVHKNSHTKRCCSEPLEMYVVVTIVIEYWRKNQA